MNSEYRLDFLASIAKNKLNNAILCGPPPISKKADNTPNANPIANITDLFLI